MKNLKNNQEIKHAETKTILDFREEFIKLCKAFEVHAFCFGTRKEVRVESEDQPGSREKMCAGFGIIQADNPTKAEVKAMIPMLENLQEDFEEMCGQVCDCENCKAERSETSERSGHAEDASRYAAAFLAKYLLNDILKTTKKKTARQRFKSWFSK